MKLYRSKNLPKVDENRSTIDFLPFLEAEHIWRHAGMIATQCILQFNGKVKFNDHDIN